MTKIDARVQCHDNTISNLLKSSARPRTTTSVIVAQYMDSPHSDDGVVYPAGEVDSADYILSERFCTEDADVTYESSDGTRFRIHSIYLKVFTAGLAPQFQSTLSEVVLLSEPALVLEMLFRFIYPTPLPDLTKVNIDFVLLLAEASEKYQVFPAMYACFLRIRGVLSKYPLAILSYALKHDYRTLANEAAPFVLDESPKEIHRAIPHEYYENWLDYYAGWRRIQQRALTTHFPVGLKVSLRTTILRINRRLSGLADNLGTIFDPALSVLAHRPAISKWRLAVEEDIKTLPTLLPLEPPEPSASMQLEFNELKDDIILISTPESSEKLARIPACSKIIVACAPGLSDILSTQPLPSEITLPEGSWTLEMLFGFLRPIRQPDFDKLTFENLNRLANAAGKYRIQQAIQPSKMFMTKSLQGHVIPVLGYAATFGHADLMNAAGPLAIAYPSREVAASLPLSMRYRWTLYHDLWQDVSRQLADDLLKPSKGTSQDQRDANSSNSTSSSSGKSLDMAFAAPILRKLLDGPKWLRTLDQLFEEAGTYSDHNISALISEARCRVESSIEEIPEFSSLPLEPISS